MPGRSVRPVPRFRVVRWRSDRRSRGRCPAPARERHGEIAPRRSEGRRHRLAPRRSGNRRRRRRRPRRARRADSDRPPVATTTHPSARPVDTANSAAFRRPCQAANPPGSLRRFCLSVGLVKRIDVDRGLFVRMMGTDRAEYGGEPWRPGERIPDAARGPSRGARALRWSGWSCRCRRKCLRRGSKTSTLHKPRSGPRPPGTPPTLTASRSASGVNTTTLNDQAIGPIPRSQAPATPQGPHVDQAEPRAKDVVDALVGIVERCMRAGDRDVRRGELPQNARSPADRRGSCLTSRKSTG